MANNFKHFIQRVYERYNIKLSLEDLRDIAEKIKIGRAKLVKATAKGYHYKVRFGKKLLLVVINRSHSYFITALQIKKNNCAVRFNGREFSYFDALYYNWLFYKQFNKIDGKVICNKCKSTKIEVCLGKDKFKCCNCSTIVKFKDNYKVSSIITILNNGKFIEVISLSNDLWWFLYKNNKTYIFKDITILPKLYDYDKLRYTIKYNNKEVYVDKGIYTEEQLKEKLNE